MAVMLDTEKRRRKWIWGCTGGCLGFLVASFLLAYIVVRVLMRPVPIVPPETFITPDTQAFLIVKVAPSDPLMVSLAVRLALLRGFLEKVPTKEGAPLQMNAERARALILQTAPVQMVRILQPGHEKAPFESGVAFSIFKYSRLFGLVVRSYMESASGKKQANFERYHGAQLAAAKSGGAIGVIENNYMGTDDEATIRDWVDAIQERRAREAQAPKGQAPAPEFRAGGQLKAAYERLDPRRPGLFASLNSQHELAGLLSLMPAGRARDLLVAAGSASDKVLSLSGELKGLNDRDAALTLFFQCADAAFAARLQAALAQIAAEFVSTSPLRDIKVERSEGAVVKLEARIENLPDKVAELATYLAQRQAQPAR
jgi:hypothetical protein